MAQINVAGLKLPVIDPTYRYKMPVLQAKTEGRGNGIKTVILNCAQIAAALKRPAPQLTKFFGCEVGAQSKYEDAGEKSVVNGTHTSKDLQILVHKYIDLFVLCSKCKNPETAMKFKRTPTGPVIRLKCAACGHKTSVDMSHKLCTFIINERKKRKQAEAEAMKGAEGKAGDEKPRKHKSHHSKEASPAEVTPVVVGDEPGSAHSTPVPEVEPKKRELEEDMKFEAIKPIDEHEKEEDDPATQPFGRIMLMQEVADIMKVTLSMCTYGIEEKVKELIRCCKSVGMKANDKVFVWFAISFTEDIYAEFDAAIDGLSYVIDQTEKQDQLSLINSVEWFATKMYPQLLPMSPAILKKLYDHELLDEATIVEFCSTPQVAEASHPDVSLEDHAAFVETLTLMLEWLKTAEYAE